MAAGLATLRNADAAVYAALDANAQRIGAMLGEALDAAGVGHRVQFAGNLVSVFFTDDPSTPITNYDQVRATQTYRFAPVLPRDARRRGVSAAERVRGVVRLGRPRRRRLRHHRRRAAGAAAAAAAATSGE